MSFIEELTQRGLIEEDAIPTVLALAKEKHNGSVEDALAELGFDKKQLLSLKSSYYGVPRKETVDPAAGVEALKYIPEDSAKHYQAVPIGIIDGVLEVGILNPDNVEALDAIRFIAEKSGMPFKMFLLDRDNFDSLMANYSKGLKGEVDSALSQLSEEELSISSEGVTEGGKKIEDASDSASSEEKIVEDAPIIKIVAVILRHATEGNASDIHIENTGDQVKVRFRVDGTLHTSLILPLSAYAGVIARIKILSKIRLDEKRKPQDGNFSAKIDGRKIDFRVSTFPTYYGEKVVMRILDSEKGVKPISSLAMSPRNLEMVKRAITRPYGLILVTGPTGSGKSTTIYSMLNEFDREGANIVSLEDPVEYHIAGVNQSQVMPEIDYTFANGLRSILRQDPDIIMVGEIRDKETAQLAIQAALTGHLVLSTLHTNSAIGAIPRLIDMGIDPYLIAPTLVLAIAQRLATATCESSKKKVPLDASTRALIDKQFADLPEEFRKEIAIGDEMVDTVPSTDCPLGTRGRMAVFEMFEVDKEMQNIILKSPTEADIYAQARKNGMFSMKEDALLKALRGEIPMRETFNF